MKKVLITAGSTIIQIDQVRSITNIFKGRTGAAIAKYFAEQGQQVTLITSQAQPFAEDIPGMNILKYKTYDELYELMKKEITTGNYDTIIHSAAVSDYRTKQVLVKGIDGNLCPVDAGTKISSNHTSLFLELVLTEKIIDKIRQPWKFTGQLVKFKLEVGKTNDELIEIGRKSRVVSGANLLVANCLEWSDKYAYFIDKKGRVTKTTRQKLPEELYRRLV